MYHRNRKRCTYELGYDSIQMGCYSLFSGPGGLDLGFEMAGASILYAADIDPVCVETYNYNRPETR